MCCLLEDFTENDFALVKGLSDGLLINSAYTMHHVTQADGDTEKRAEYFRTLRQLDAVLLATIEPDSDHDEEDLFTTAGNILVRCSSLSTALPSTVTGNSS